MFSLKNKDIFLDKLLKYLQIYIEKNKQETIMIELEAFSFDYFYNAQCLNTIQHVTGRPERFGPCKFLLSQCVFKLEHFRTR